MVTVDDPDLIYWYCKMLGNHLHNPPVCHIPFGLLAHAQIVVVIRDFRKRLRSGTGNYTYPDIHTAMSIASLLAVWDGT